MFIKVHLVAFHPRHRMEYKVFILLQIISSDNKLIAQNVTRLVKSIKIWTTRLCRHFIIFSFGVFSELGYMFLFFSFAFAYFTIEKHRS